MLSVLNVIFFNKVAGVKVYPRQTWNFSSHAVSACISLCHHRPMHACTACIATWHHRPMHAVTEWAVFWFRLGYTFTSSYFVKKYDIQYRSIRNWCPYPSLLNYETKIYKIQVTKILQKNFEFINMKVKIYEALQKWMN